MTERSESERAELVARIERAFQRNVNCVITPIEARGYLTALRRLAAQDQKPTSVRLEARPAGLDKDWIEIFPSQLSGMAKVGHDVRAIEIDPPPAAGWDEAIEACTKVADTWRNSANPYRADTANAICQGFEALRHNAPPDHGRADAGVGVKPLEWEHQNRTMQAYTVRDSRGIDYYINQSFGSDCYYFATVKHDGAILYDGDDLEAAKAAAQADYEKRILPALSHYPAPVAANASAELQNDLGEMLRALDMSDAAQPMSPHEVFQSAIAEMKRRLANASAEARLREALTTVEDLIRRDPACFNLSDELQSVRSVLREALSAHPHASDCDKQGEIPCNYIGPCGWKDGRPSDRTADVTALADAMWQLLDDMGENGQGVCLAAKAQARVAYEAFREDEYADWMPLERAKQVLKEAGA